MCLVSGNDPAVPTEKKTGTRGAPPTITVLYRESSEFFSPLLVDDAMCSMNEITTNQGGATRR